MIYSRRMAFKIVRNDITKMKVDAIVNTANEAPVYGEGVDTAIYMIEIDIVLEEHGLPCFIE